MESFHGTIANYSLARRFFLFFAVIMAPLISFAVTVYLFMNYSWWSLFIAVDIIVVVIAFSLSGQLFRGTRIVVDRGRIFYIKGWSRGSFDLTNIIRVYRVKAEGRNAILIVFRDSSVDTPQNRCLSVEQLFDDRDRKEIFRLLSRKRSGNSFRILDDAPLDTISRDKHTMGWVPV